MKLIVWVENFFEICFVNKINMQLENTKLNAQEVELLIDFQMEELEERFEMEQEFRSSWFTKEVQDDGGPVLTL